MAIDTASSSAKTTTDPEEIRRWAESRNGRPACVRGTGGANDIGMLRIDFPGFSGGETLAEISWDEFFRAFDENNLAFLYQDRTGDGAESRFFKLVSRSNDTRSETSRKAEAKTNTKTVSKSKSGAKSKSSKTKAKSKGGAKSRGGVKPKSAGSGKAKSTAKRGAKTGAKRGAKRRGKR